MLDQIRKYFTSCRSRGEGVGLVRVREGVGLVRVREGVGLVRVREGVGLIGVRDVEGVGLVRVREGVGLIGVRDMGLVRVRDDGYRWGLRTADGQTMREEPTGMGEEKLGDCENISGIKGC